MRKLSVLAVFSAVALACGGGSKSNNSSSGPVSGTIAGHAFTPTDVKALLVGTDPTPCFISTYNANVGIKAFAVELTSYANACSDFGSATCAFHPDSETVTLLFAKLNAIPPASEPTIQPDSYPLATSPAGAVSEGVGVYHLAYAQAIAPDATCSAASLTPLMPASGTLRIDSVAGPITGHVTVSLVNGSTQAAAGSIEGDFSAPLCSQSIDVCGLVTALTTGAGGGALPPPELFCSPTGATCAP